MIEARKEEMAENNYCIHISIQKTLASFSKEYMSTYNSPGKFRPVLRVSMINKAENVGRTYIKRN